MNEPIRKSPPSTGRGGSARSLAMLGAVLFVGLSLYAFRAPPPAPATAAADDKKPAAPEAGAVAAANAFLDALDAKLREKALYEFGSDRKPRWSNLPVTMVPRNGVRLGDLTKAQRALAMAAVAAVLSKGGYQKVVDIIDADQQLAEGRGGRGRGGRGGGKGPGAMFGADQYYLAIFGKPSATQPWMVQFGGHHLGLNVTVVGKHFVLTPTHTGAQPALFKRDGKDVRPLGLENDTAFKLVNALDEKQRAQAILGDRPQQELLLGPGRDGRKIEPQGIKGSALTAAQQAMLLDVIGAWVDIVGPEAAKARMAEIKGKVGETYFAWKGPTAKGSAAYFRVQGPAVVIEYAPQGGTGHIHTVVRNPNDDYGAGLLKR
ncbi:MAG TPA: DUF3500 domain-containing protein [Gemmataceae bacterium]|jgi:hypothetical protein|nr:DUF3500 domain-containing protein [Gemmataceae bacterium]